MYRILLLALKKVHLVKITPPQIPTSRKHSWDTPSPYQGKTFWKLSHLGEGTKFLLKWDKHEKGGDVKKEVAT